MAVNNLKKFRESAQKHNIKDFQLIMGSAKTGTNVKGMLISGYMFDRLSLYGLSGTDDIDELMQNIACYGVAKAYEMHVSGRRSVAKQKVNDAHGRTEDERADYILKQIMTYGKRFKNIQFVGQTIEGVFDQMIENTDLTLDRWVKGMQDWHGKNAKAKVFDAITNKKMHVLNDNKVICDCAFREHIEQYVKENKLSLPNEEQQTQMINTYLKGLERV